MKIINLSIPILFCLLFFCSSCGVNGSKKADKSSTSETLSVVRIECEYVVMPRFNHLYVIENDSIFCNGIVLPVDIADIKLLNSYAEFIDSAKHIYNGACIENDAAGVLYTISVGENISEWTNCFPREDMVEGKAKEVMDVLDKYFLYAYKQVFEVDYPCISEKKNVSPF